ncbi:protein FAM8A1 [Suncus etruscus]|uniref:protein FAM8A1 n=1 Tax=Suncus etruscus TaxID=109475 RepID=UPI00210F99C3|nr:protein FAM8A1 [Suncus etruscus]
MNGGEPRSGHAPGPRGPSAPAHVRATRREGRGFRFRAAELLTLARGRARPPEEKASRPDRTERAAGSAAAATMAEGAEETRDDGGGGDGGGPDAAVLRGAAEELPGERGKLSAREYSRQVHEWLWQAYCGYLTWHSGLAAVGYYNVPFYSAAAAATAAAGPVPGPATPNGLATPAAPGTRVAAATAAPSRSPSETGRQAGREYVIPSLAHRFMAEMVDFFILFFIKATIVLSIMHLSGIKDISKFAMHYIIEEIDEDTSMEDLQKMMVVALIYRLLVCFYEIICIWGAGGATPGKFLLGLRVVTCDTSVLIAPSRVLVIPSSNVTITTSTIRALIKNFSIASFFPAFITLLFFQHNRTAYDIVAGTIVVKRNGVR